MSSWPSPQDEAIRICRELIAFDTSNYGDGSGPGERACAEYVVGLLQEVGLDPELVESDPGRASVMVRLEGADPARPGLAVHGHLDVVPAAAADWSVDPFAAEVTDGCIWGRGAVDMKDMDAMMLASVRDLVRTGTKPSRDLTVVFFADEEAGGRFGSHWVAEHRPDWFEGVTEAVSEVGGFSVTVPRADGTDARAYLLQTAEKGIAWLRLVARGKAGHGSLVHHDNAVAHLGAAVARIAAYQWPRDLVAPVRTLLDGFAELTGVPFDETDLDGAIDRLGSAGAFVRPTTQDTANPTMLDAGYKVNVVPQTATAAVDCRYLPGHEESLMATIRELAGEHVDVEVIQRDVDLDSPFDAPLPDAMSRAVLAEDPGATVLPYCLSGGTDNKALSLLGVTGYGFAPLRLPPELDFVSLFHGIDERVPLDALAFGTAVMRRFLVDC